MDVEHDYPPSPAQAASEIEIVSPGPQPPEANPSDRKLSDAFEVAFAAAEAAASGTDGCNASEVQNSDDFREDEQEKDELTTMSTDALSFELPSELRSDDGGPSVRPAASPASPVGKMARQATPDNAQPCPSLGDLMDAATDAESRSTSKAEDDCSDLLLSTEDTHTPYLLPSPAVMGSVGPYSPEGGRRPARPNKGPAHEDAAYPASASPSMPGPYTPSAGSQGPPLPMKGDLPADMLEAVPGEPPTTIPMSSQIVAPASLISHNRSIQPQANAQPEPVAPLASTPFAPHLRGMIAAHPRAENFLGRPPCPAPVPENRGEVELARWHVGQRRVEAALRFLNREESPASIDADILRVRTLVALRRYTTAAEALSRLISAADTSIAVPFELHVLNAQMPYLLDAADAPKALWQLQVLASAARDTKSDTTDKPASTRFTDRLHLLRVLSRVSLGAGHSDVAVAEIRAALEEQTSLRDETDAQERRSQLHSLLGRHFISGGDSASAAIELDLAHRSRPASATASLDSGYLSVSHGNYAAAAGHFMEAVKAAEAKLSAADAAGTAEPVVDELVAAANNLAVCRLYTQELRQGIKGLEDLIRRNPVRFLRQSVAQNLSGLYEFTTDAASRRAVLRDVVAAFHIEDLEPRTFDGPGAA